MRTPTASQDREPRPGRRRLGDGSGPLLALARVRPARSQAATAEQVEHPRFKRWTEAMNHRMMFHRKLWEWCYTLEALDRAGAMRPGRVRSASVWGRRRSPPSWRRSASRWWRRTSRPREPVSGPRPTSTRPRSRPLVREDVCLARRSTGSSRPARWTCGPSLTDLPGFDAVWSSCCFEHLGSPQAGLDFVLASMDCLRPGGLAVHTTEFDVHPSDEVVDPARRCSTAARSWPAWPVYYATWAPAAVQLPAPGGPSARPPRGHRAVRRRCTCA